MFQDNLFRELIIDNFAGGGGASTGIELATGMPVDIAINHDEDAISMHKVNHPHTVHYQEDVFAIDSEKVTGGRPVGIAWFSPDCKHFSRAKGGKPVDKKIRGLSWVIIKWAMSSVAPRCIFMENVPEIQTWGPLTHVEDKGLYPDTARAGETFKGFISILTSGIDKDHPALKECCEFLHIDLDGEEAQKLIKGLGYKVDWRELKACDYGAPTIRKRFYLIARNDGKPIVFPKPTHGKGKGLKPYRTASECIDWSIPCPSIFDRKKPLKPNTLRRIARGLDKFVIKNNKPFIMQVNYDNTPQDVDKPISTITAVNKHYIVNPSIVPIGYGEKKGQKPRVNDIIEPLSTVVSTCKQNLVLPKLTPYIVSNNTNNAPHDVEQPMPTVTTGARNYVCMPSLIQYHGGESKSKAARGQVVDRPIMTIDTQPRYAVNACYISKYFSGENQAGSDIGEPLSTITAKDHNALVMLNITSRYGNGQDGRGSAMDMPMPTVTGTPHSSIVASNLCVLRKNMDGKSLDKPMPTITTSAGHFAQITTYLEKIDTTQDLHNWDKVRALLNEYAGYNIADDEILIIEINGEKHFISDVGMRMLKAKELMLAQGFPIDYVLDIESAIGKKYCEAKQIARMGNAVCPPVAEALIRANCPEMANKTKIKTMEKLTSTIEKVRKVC